MKEYYMYVELIIKSLIPIKRKHDHTKNFHIDIVSECKEK